VESSGVRLATIGLKPWVVIILKQGFRFCVSLRVSGGSEAGIGAGQG
jgi:hypothetical protein